MKCEEAQKYIALLVYQELPDDTRPQLEHHLAGCEGCREELEGVQALHRAMAILPMQEPPPNLLARARMRLEEALDSMPNRGWLSRITQLLVTGVGRFQAAPAFAASVLVLGLAGGGFAGYHAGRKVEGPSAGNAQATIAAGPDSGDDASIASVSSIVRVPNSEQVEVRFNRLVPEVMHGSLDDADVRKLLLLGAQSRADNGIHDNSVGLLAGECQAGHDCGDGLRKALLVALRYDKSASVRLVALNGLQPYIDQDMRVRDAVLKAITSDRDPAVRMQAINLLQPVEGDSSVRGVLHTAASRDTNPGIRTVSQHVLDQLPETQ